MTEIIDTIINLLYKLKYGSIINGQRDYIKKIESCIELTGSEADLYKDYVKNQVNLLKLKPHSIGNAKYVIFEKHRAITRIFVLNEEYQFMYRLHDYTSTSYSFYFKIEY